MIEGLQKYQRRKAKGSYFDDLPPHLRELARWHLRRLRDRWQGHLPRWRLAILVGRARWLAVRRPESAWGRSMHAKRGGYAVQRLYRWTGRQPTAKATRVRVYRQKKPREPQVPPIPGA